MEPNVPIPTDHIYKFGTSFGFIMVIAATLAFSYIIEKYDEPNVTYSLELELLKAKDNLSRDETVRKSFLEGVIALNRSKERLTLFYLVIFWCIGVLISISSGRAWFRKVQPKHDELLNLQIEKMKREIQVLENQLEKKDME